MAETAVGLDLRAAASTAGRLRAWLSSGACQSATGAFVAWVDLATGRGSYEYPEITGYALTFLAGLESLTDAETAAGYRAGEWLVDRIRAGNLAAKDGWDNGAVYLFDLGMIASGLLMFGRRTEVTRFVDAGLELVGYLREELSARVLSPISQRSSRSDRRNWSTRGVAHLAKLSQAFLLAEELGWEGRAAAERVVEEVKQLQSPDGRFPTDPHEPTAMLHPHLYAAEGLWIWGSAVGDDDALARAGAAVDWVWRHQLDGGGLPAAEADEGRNGVPLEQSDVTAQAVRLALALDARSPSVDRAVARLVELGGSDGIVYRPQSGHAHMNTWATLFAAQALGAAETQRLAWQHLV